MLVWQQAITWTNEDENLWHLMKFLRPQWVNTEDSHAAFIKPYQFDPWIMNQLEKNS